MWPPLCVTGNVFDVTAVNVCATPLAGPSTCPYVADLQQSGCGGLIKVGSD